MTRFPSWELFSIDFQYIIILLTWYKTTNGDEILLLHVIPQYTAYSCLYVVLPACVCAKLLQLCLTLCDPMDYIEPARLLCPWDIPGKNTGVGFHFFFFLQGIFLTQRSNPRLLHWQAGSLPLAPLGKPRSLSYNSTAQKRWFKRWCQPLSKTPKACKQLANKIVENLSERTKGKINLYTWQNSNYESLEVKDCVYAGWTKGGIEMCVSIKQMVLLPLLGKAHLSTSLD